MMMGMCIRGFLRGTAFAAVLGLAVFTDAREKPNWEIEVDESKLATFEAVTLHPKEGDWLLTCRMRVKSLKLISRISEIEFVGLGATVEGEEEEVLWEKSHTVRRKDFEAAYGGGRSQFVRVFLREVPADVVEVRLRYGFEEEAK